MGETQSTRSARCPLPPRSPRTRDRDGFIPEPEYLTQRGRCAPVAGSPPRACHRQAGKGRGRRTRCSSLLRRRCAPGFAGQVLVDRCSEAKSGTGGCPRIRRRPLRADYGGQVRRRPLRADYGLPPVPRGGKVSSLNRSRPTTQSPPFREAGRSRPSTVPALQPRADRRPWRSPLRRRARKLPHDAAVSGQLRVERERRRIPRRRSRGQLSGTFAALACLA